jgi:hypothetical protein
MSSLEVPSHPVVCSAHFAGLGPHSFQARITLSTTNGQLFTRKQCDGWTRGSSRFIRGTGKSICVVKRATSIQGQQAGRVAVGSKMLKRKKNNRIKTKKRMIKNRDGSNFML